MEKKEMYYGDKPLNVVEQNNWPETLAGGKFELLNELYDNFLNEEEMKVQLVFKKLGIYSFGGFGSSADTEGNAQTVSGTDPADLNAVDVNLSKAKKDKLTEYLIVPINPEEIRLDYAVNTNTYKTVYFSELASMSGLKLRRFSINSFFPYRISAKRQFGTEPIYEPADYINWITECMDNKIILAFRAFGDLARPIPYMKCFISGFNTTLLATGEVKYTLEICEYIDYRTNVDQRQFSMSGTNIVISAKENVRYDSAIGLGDFVNVVSGSIYSDELKHSALSVGNVLNSCFRFPPSIITSNILTKRGSEDYFKQYGVVQSGDSAIYNLASTDTIKFIADLIKSSVQRDETEIWRVVGGDYFSKFRGRTMTNTVMSSIAQWQNILDETGLAGQNWSHNVKIISMRDGRTGWVDLYQLKKTNFMGR